MEDRAAIARAFIAKAIYNLTSTRSLIDYLQCDPVMRRICGWERVNELPSESTFSRVFEEFAKESLANKLQDKFIEQCYSGHIIGHISRDSTAIKGREKAAYKSKVITQAKKPKKRCSPKN